MNRLKNLALGALALLLIAGAATGIAQVITLPQVQVIHPTDLLQVIPYGQPSTGNVYATPAQITSQNGYYKSIPATNFTYTFSNSTSYAAFAPSGGLTTGTVTLAAAPSDGARECIFSTQTITSLTVNANTGQTINNAVTTLSANTSACYLYSASNLTWDRD